MFGDPVTLCFQRNCDTRAGVRITTRLDPCKLKLITLSVPQSSRLPQRQLRICDLKLSFKLEFLPSHICRAFSPIPDFLQSLGRFCRRTGVTPVSPHPSHPPGPTVGSGGLFSDSAAVSPVQARA
ncbi:unnamed protein product [Gulo gulo]|uniref:Uncharacterized protein n=1 Tax=Gulo gulo TaxID=48420 RepID=A0A9X9Q161_GULGU|nr:unnamed protein product [Gulo gulo]